ncbi:hypothetical protein KR222_001633, partial [Zaprionus bogoriensis]
KQAAREQQPQQQQHVEQEQRSWIQRSGKNQPQWNALGASNFVFLSGGMSLAWGAGFAEHSRHLSQTLHMRICWSGAALLGALLSAALTHRTPQRPVYIFSSCLVLMCGILFLTLPEQPSAIIAARYLDGFANGLVFVPTLSTLGELSVYEMRGVLAASVEQLSCNFGILILLFYTSIWQSEWNASIVADQVHGLLSILYGIVALGLALTLCVESPVYLLLRRNEQAAVVALRHLQRPSMVTSETFLQLDEHKRYVVAQRDLSWSRSIRHSLVPLLKLTVHRSLCVLSLTPIVWSAVSAAAIKLTPQFHTWPYAVFGMLRWSGCCCVVFLMDSAGRKKPSLFGTFAGGAFAIAFATLFERAPHWISSLSMLLSFQFFAGVANAASPVYLTEAFPLRVKPYCVALIYANEQLLRIGLSILTPTNDDIVLYFFILGGISMGFFLLGIFCLPETKQTTLAQAHIKIRTWFNEDF